jgi:hypothetical protein
MFRISGSSSLHNGCNDPEILRYENLKSVPQVLTSDNVGVDADSGIVHSLETTTAKVHDSRVWDELLHGKETSVWADRGYVSAAREARVLRAGQVLGRHTQGAQPNRIRADDTVRPKGLDAGVPATEVLDLPPRNRITCCVALPGLLAALLCLARRASNVSTTRQRCHPGV